MTIDASFSNATLRPAGAGHLARGAIDLVHRFRDRVVAELTPDPVNGLDAWRDIPHAPDVGASAGAADSGTRRGDDHAGLKRWLILSCTLLATVLLLDLLVLMLTWAPLSLGRAAVPAAESRPATRIEQAQSPGIAPARISSSWPIMVPEAESPPVITMAELRASAATLLAPAEVREVQDRLQAFGFDPGKVDGTEGPRTRAAAKAYRSKRGLIPAVDAVDRNLLAALRQDPSPKAAASRPRSNNPIDAIVRWWKTL